MLYCTYKALEANPRSQNMENTEFSLELDVTEVATEQDYVSSGVTSTGCCKN